MDSVVTNRSHLDHWRRLNHWLQTTQALWQPVPFAEPRPAWCDQYPELTAWLLALSDAHCEHYENDPVALAQALEPWLPQFGGYRELTRVTDLRGPDLSLPETRARDMPGRKRLQAGAFSGSLVPLAGSVLEWCCGKGHLARTLAAHGTCQVTGLEWNRALVVAGNRLGAEDSNPVTLWHQDVMASDLVWPTPPPAQVVALHACGDLHRRLLTRAADSTLARVSLAPCCYHLTAASEHQPLSEQLRAEPDRCRVSRDDLRLAVRETVTAGRGVRRRTRQRSAWRLGFDLLQRHLRGVDEYLPVPSEPGAVLGGAFRDFCLWAAARKGLNLQEGIRFEQWELAGWRRHHEVRRFELVRHLCRRPLELWLLLDYAVFLEERGYGVRLGEFCDRALTPRNLLLDGWRKEKGPA